MNNCELAEITFGHLQKYVIKILLFFSFFIEHYYYYLKEISNIVIISKKFITYFVGLY